jgi:hypothetical protein
LLEQLLHLRYFLHWRYVNRYRFVLSIKHTIVGVVILDFGGNFATTELLLAVDQLPSSRLAPSVQPIPNSSRLFLSLSLVSLATAAWFGDLLMNNLLLGFEIVLVACLGVAGSCLLLAAYESVGLGGLEVQITAGHWSGFFAS